MKPFNPSPFGTVHDLRKSAKNANDAILMVACSDHGTAPCHLSIADPARLIVVQNLAVSIPRAGQNCSLSTLASIQYAVTLKQVGHVIVCGHRKCGIIERWQTFRKNADTGPAPDRELHAVWSALDEIATTILRERSQEIIVREHLLRQVANLQSHDFVRRRLEEGTLRLHAWIVDDATASVRAYDPHSGQFRTLGGRGENSNFVCNADYSRTDRF